MHGVVQGMLVATTVFLYCLGSTAQQCGPDRNTLGDIELVSVAVSSPNSRGLVTITLEYQLFVGAGESVSASNFGVYRNGSIFALIPVDGTSYPQGSTCNAEGWGGCTAGLCAGTCPFPDSGCVCKSSPSGAYHKCKCYTGLIAKTIVIQATSNDVLMVRADDEGVQAEDNECNNEGSAMVP